MPTPGYPGSGRTHKNGDIGRFRLPEWSFWNVQKLTNDDTIHQIFLYSDRYGPCVFTHTLYGEENIASMALRFLRFALQTHTSMADNTRFDRDTLFLTFVDAPMPGSMTFNLLIAAWDLDNPHMRFVECVSMPEPRSPRLSDSLDDWLNELPSHQTIPIRRVIPREIHPITYNPPPDYAVVNFDEYASTPMVLGQYAPRPGDTVEPPELAEPAEEPDTSETNATPRRILSSQTNLGSFNFPAWNRFGIHKTTGNNDFIIKFYMGNRHVLSHVIRRYEGMRMRNRRTRQSSIEPFELDQLRLTLQYALQFAAFTDDQNRLMAQQQAMLSLPAYLYPAVYKQQINSLWGLETWRMMAMTLYFTPVNGDIIVPNRMNGIEPPEFRLDISELNELSASIDMPENSNLIRWQTPEDMLTSMEAQIAWNKLWIIYEGATDLNTCCQRCAGWGTRSRGPEPYCGNCGFLCDLCETPQLMEYDPARHGFDSPQTTRVIRIKPGSGGAVHQIQICTSCSESQPIYKCPSCEYHTIVPLVDISVQGLTTQPDIPSAVCVMCIRDVGRCTLCTNAVGGKLYRYKSHPGIEKRVCVPCFNKEFMSCQDCNAVYSRSECAHVDDLCKRCVERPFRRYNYKPRPRFHQLPEEADPLFMGIEIELEFRKKFRGRESAAKAQCTVATELTKSFGDIFYYKSDGSLRYEGPDYVRDGIEIVTHPMTLPYFQHLGFAERLGALSNDFRGYKSTRTGMHVHLPKAAFEDAHLSRFVLFHYNNKEFIRFIGQRRENRYSAFGKYNKAHIQKKAGNKEGLQHEKYEAININHKQTVEMRYFKSNLAPNRIVKNLQFLHALYYFSKDSSDADMTLNRFMQFVNSKPEYEVLAKFIDERNRLFIFADDSENEDDDKVVVNDVVCPAGKVGYYIQTLSSNSAEREEDSLTASPVYELE